MSTHPEKLRNLSQNEYMIDTLYLPVGRALNEAAGHMEALEAEVERLTAERDGLAKALRLLSQDVQDYEPWQRPCYALDQARAALAALPTKEDDDE